MTDSELARQIRSAAQQALERCSVAQPICATNYADEIFAAYLSGISQSASMLVRGDGETTPQQLERAVLLAGQELGLHRGPPRPPA